MLLISVHTLQIELHLQKAAASADVAFMLHRCSTKCAFGVSLRLKLYENTRKKDKVTAISCMRDVSKLCATSLALKKTHLDCVAPAERDDCV